MAIGAVHTANESEPIIFFWKGLKLTGKTFLKTKIGRHPPLQNNMSKFVQILSPYTDSLLTKTQTTQGLLRTVRMKSSASPNSCDANIGNSGFYCHMYNWLHLHFQYKGRREWERRGGGEREREREKSYFRSSATLRGRHRQRQTTEGKF